MRSKLICGALALGPLFVACGQVADPADEGVTDPVGADMEAIVGGVPATAYREGAVLNMKSAAGLSYACSATLISPNVVLTAGHCVDGMVAWDVYVGTAYRPAVSAETYDWNEHGATTVNPAHHDIGLVYLKDPIALPSYPLLNSVKQADGTPGVAIGRILNGTLTNSLYQANSSISDGTKVGFPFSYHSPTVIEHGDSGGPFMLSGTHTIAAVNSGAGGGTQVLARVDLLSAWIAQRIASHAGTTQPPLTGAAGAMNAAAAKGGAGGAAGAVAAKGGAGGDAAKGGAGGAAGSAVAGKGGAGGAAGAVAAKGGAGGDAAKGGAGGAAGSAVAGKGGAGGAAGSLATAGAKASAGMGGSGGANMAAGAGASGACVSELEPNNDLPHASTINGTTCGSLSSTTDIDWFVMSLSAGSSTLTLTADKDATFSIGYVAGTTCATALTGARQVQVNVTGANAKVCLAVSSATHVVQSYKISR